MNPNRLLLSCFVTLALIHPAMASAAETTKSSDWEYPELAVSPRASERLEREAKLEGADRRTEHWALQLSAAGTLVSGFLGLAQPDRSKDPERQAAWVGIGAGSAWLIGTWLLSTHYTPYATGASEVAAMPAKSTREQLARERAAEQAIEAAARTGTRLKWLSFLSNGMASAYMVSNSRNDSAAKVAAIGSLVLSATPLVFTHHWNDVARQQQDYKKRIFGPVAGISATAFSDGIRPVFAMQWRW